MSEPDQQRPTRVSDLLTNILVAQARVETKVDAFLDQLVEVDVLAKEMTDHGTRLTKLETYQGIFFWVINGGWALLAALAFILAKLGVL